MFQQSQDDRSSLEAAAEAAAKVNAMLIAKGMLKPNQIHGGPNVITKKAGGPNSLVVAEVEINNLTTPCRNTLTRGTTQEEISKASGAAVTTRGRYMAPDDKVRNPRDRCLYLNVQASTKESVDIAVQKINEIIKSMSGNKIEQRGRGMNHHRGRGMRHQYRPPLSPNRNSLRSQAPPPLMSLPTPPPPPVQVPLPTQPPPQTVTILQEKLYVGLEHAPPNFDTKNKLLGPEGSFLHHIQLETGAAVSLRGKSSGFLDLTGADSIEPMHVHIEHQSLVGLQEAKKLAENLIQTVQQSYVSFQQALAALPASVPTGLITGVRQQPPYLEPQLVQPPIAHVPEQLQALQPQIQQLGPPPVILPAASAANQIPPLHQTIQNTAPGPPMVIPSSLALTQLPLVNTLSVSAPSVLTHQPTPIEQQQQQQLILSQPPQQGPPQLVQPQQNPLAAAPGAPGPPPQQLHHPGLQPSAVYTSVQPTLQLVSQPMVSVMQPGQQPPIAGPPPPPVAQPQPQLQPQPQPQPLPLLMGPPPAPQHPYPATTSLVYTVTSSTGVPYYSSPKLEEMPKRRFTEEKDDSISDGVLGYQHGPPHLVNLVRSSPPPNSQSTVTPLAPQPHPQQHVIQLAPPEQAQFAQLANHPAIIQAPGQHQPHQIQLQPQSVAPPPHFHHPAAQHQQQQQPPPPHPQFIAGPHGHLLGPPPPAGPAHSPNAHQMSQPVDIRLQVPPSSSTVLMPPPPPPSPLSSQAGIREEEIRSMMPPPKSPEFSWEAKQRGPSPSPFESDKKKIRGILKNKNHNSSGSETDKEVAELSAESAVAGRKLSQEEAGGEGPESAEDKHHLNHPASPQYQGQPLRYPSMPSDPNLPPTSVHEQQQQLGGVLPPGHHPPPHQLRPLHPGHPQGHLLHQAEAGHVLTHHPHIHLEGPRAEAPPGTQIILEHTGLPPPGMHLAQPGHPTPQRIEIAGPPPPQQRQVILEQHPMAHSETMTPHLAQPPHAAQELYELEMQQQQQHQQQHQQQQQQQLPPPPQFHHMEHIVASQSSQVAPEQMLPPGSAVIVTSGQPFPQYSVAISSAAGVVPPPPPPPQSYALATSGVGAMPLAIHSGAHHILTGPPPPPPPPAVSSYSLGVPPPPISSYSVGVPPPSPPTSSTQFQQHFAGMPLQPQPGHIFQPGQQPQQQQPQPQQPQPQQQPPMPAASSQYQPVPHSQPAISYWLSQAQ